MKGVPAWSPGGHRFPAMKFFNSIATEIVIVPVALVLGAGLAMMLFDSTMSRNAISMLADQQEQALVRETLGVIETIAERARGEGTLFLAQIGSGIEDAKLNEVKIRAEKGLVEADVYVTRLSVESAKVEWLTPVNQGPAVLELIKAYRTALDDLNQMAVIDRMIGVAMVGNVEAKFAKLHEWLIGWRTAVNEAADKSRQENQAAAARARVTILGAAAAGMALLLVVCLFIVRKLVRSITSMSRRMSTLSQGDTAVTIPGVGRPDEIGEMATAVEIFRENAIEVERMRVAQEQQRHQAEQDKRQTMNQLADAFDTSVRNIVSTVSSAARQLQSNAQSMSANADQTTRQCTVVATAAEQASVNVQTVASATEELTSSINEISRQVMASTRIGTTAVEEATRANATVAGLTEAAQKIGAVVQLINEIASQTNLLALNATIEAARAGEAGKGFAVVASEVKNLANQTAKATEDIQAQVGQMQAVTGVTVNAIQTITGTIRQMSEISTAIASAVEEQGSATREIARNVSEASRGTQEVSSNIVGVSNAARETGEAANETLSAANDLGAQSENLAREVERFISRVRQS